ncbi:MAG TPA: DUF429 domain-containing protein [Micromonosporaceae bacterium]
MSERSPGSARVLGVDACKRGWIGIVCEEERTSAVLGRTIVELVAAAESASEFEVVAIDIPIGLPDAGRRQADLQARARVGPRWQSVFMTPVRPALVAESRVDADRINRELTGDGVSAQAYALRSRILEAEAWVRQRTRLTVEIHPEVSFATMAGVPLLDSKTTWAGVERRRQLLAKAGIRLVGELGHVGSLAGVDDVLDAAAAAWSARRVAAGEASSLPSPPQMFSDGLPSAIWA